MGSHPSPSRGARARGLARSAIREARGVASSSEDRWGASQTPRRSSRRAWNLPGCVEQLGVSRSRVVRTGSSAKEMEARHGESLTLEPRGGPMGSGFFSSGAFSAGAASSCGSREGGRGGERTGRCARALSDRRSATRGVFVRRRGRGTTRAGKTRDGKSKTSHRASDAVRARVGRTAARTRKATRALFWALAENLLLREEQETGTARSVARSRAREGPLPGRKTYRDNAQLAHRSMIHFPNQRVRVRETRARARSRTYPETAARAASWGAAAQKAAIASEVGV